MGKTDGEKIVALETNMANIERRLTGIENSVASLHGKFDAYSKLVTENYVSKSTFEEYKKNRRLEQSLAFIIGAIITGLVALAFREMGV